MGGGASRPGACDGVGGTAGRAGGDVSVGTAPLLVEAERGGVVCGAETAGGEGAVGRGGAPGEALPVGAAAGLVSAGGPATGAWRVAAAGGAAVPDCCLVIAFSTSPGLEMCDRSILVLIPSFSVRLCRDCLDEVDWASA